MPQHTAEINPFFWLPGLVSVVGTAILAARILWEETIWTCERGPQQIGLALAHGVGALLFLFPILLAIWAFVAALFVSRRLLDRQRVPARIWMILRAAVVVLALLAIPYPWWQRAFAGRLVNRPWSAEFMIAAAARDDFRTIAAFVHHGEPVDSVDSNGRTALQIAAADGKVRVVRYLVQHGANLDLCDPQRDSALDMAAVNGQRTVAEILAKAGARRIHHGH